MTSKYMNVATIEKAIVTVAKTGKALDDLIQMTGLSILNHIQQHGEASLLVKLYTALPRGARKKALLDWSCKYGAVTLNVDDKGKVDKLIPLVFKKGRPTDLVGATAEPWFECAPEKIEDVDFDFAGLLAMLLAKADKAEAKGLPIKGLERLAAVRLAASLALAPAEAANGVGELNGAFPDAEEDAA